MDKAIRKKKLQYFLCVSYFEVLGRVDKCNNVKVTDYTRNIACNGLNHKLTHVKNIDVQNKTK